MKSFLNEFKEFINRGNVIDMAVGVVIGSAFTSIVNSVVNDLIMPIVGILIGGIDFTSLAITFGGASITYGTFIQNVINFLIIAFVVFSVVKLINKMQTAFKKEEEPAPEVPAAVPEDIQLLTEIRDLLKEQK